MTHDRRLPELCAVRPTANFTLRPRRSTNSTNTQQTSASRARARQVGRVDARPVGEHAGGDGRRRCRRTAEVDVTVKPPADAPADTYPIVVRAVGGPIAAETQLSVEITGSYAMTLDTSDGRLNARVIGRQLDDRQPGRRQHRHRAARPDVTLTATPPSGWTVTFDPETIETIAAGRRRAPRRRPSPRRRRCARRRLHDHDPRQQRRCQ